jgi:transposase-like protein
MSSDSTHDANDADRVSISCPGCGRHDFVWWPRDRDTYPWKCFNCGKSFTLDRAGGHAAAPGATS